MKKNDEFELIERATCFENVRLKVNLDKVSNGISTVEQYLMVSPQVQTQGHLSGICILPEIDRTIGLMHCYRYQFKEYIWQAPMGFIESNELPADTASRELKEETGFSASVIESLGYAIPDAGLIEAKVALFLARECQRESNAPLTIEPGMGKLTFFDKSSLKELLINHAAQVSGATAIACYRYLLDN